MGVLFSSCVFQTKVFPVFPHIFRERLELAEATVELWASCYRPKCPLARSHQEGAVLRALALGPPPAAAAPVADRPAVRYGIRTLLMTSR